MNANQDVPDEQEDVCGYSYDHDLEIIFEDDKTISWECRECGAELYKDKDKPL